MLVVRLMRSSLRELRCTTRKVRVHCEDFKISAEDFKISAEDFKISASTAKERTIGAASWRPRVGDRVRVRGGIALRTDPDGLPHYLEEEGKVGTVAAVRPLPSSLDHAYLVQLDEPHPRVLLGTVPFELSFRHYAADELQPSE